MYRINDEIVHLREHGAWKGYAPCVGSGMCCKKGPCVFGVWDAAKHQCAYLEIDESHDGFDIYRCGEYERIVKSPGSDWNPAFGAGCCMSLFNDNRERILRYLVRDRDRGTGGGDPCGDPPAPEQ